MQSFISLLVLAGLLGLTSFGFGMLPLSFSYSGKRLSQLSALGNGLLLGTALGVVIPEGIETLSNSAKGSHIPISTIALSLVVGFSAMLVVEQLSSSHAHESPLPRTSSATAQPPKPQDDADVQFDVELGAFDEETGASLNTGNVSPVRKHIVEEEGKQIGYPLTVGLVLHGITDGLALGVSSLSTDSTGGDLFVVVFIALAVHKAPTALAFTTTLLSTPLSRAECKKHLIIFSSSTPVGAIAAYGLFSFLGISDMYKVGIALLISGGSFLYAATVLQPVSHNMSPSEGVGKTHRTLLVLFGIFAPFVLSIMFEHGH